MSEAKHVKGYRILAFILALLCAIEIINLLSGRWLNQFSILPRHAEHLLYIFTSPFLHGDLAHFTSNIVSLGVLSFLLLQFGVAQYVKVSTGVIIISGLLVWSLGREAYHLGASGLIYGYFGYLVLAGWLSKRLFLALISLLVIVLYGGMIWGVLPSRPYISWEFHLFGFISGLVLAWYLKPARD